MSLKNFNTKKPIQMKNDKSELIIKIYLSYKYRIK